MEEKVMEALGSGTPMKAGEVAEKTGIDKVEVTKVLKKLVKQEKVFSPKMCFYQIK